MFAGQRVAKLRAANGESLRDAANRTGVSHTTIARIEKGDMVSSFHSTLRKIADGYGVRLEYLLAGRDPRQDFELSVGRLPAPERCRLYFVSPWTRTLMVLHFLQAEYPNEVPMEVLARQADCDRALLQSTCETGAPLPEEACQRLTDALSRLTGISASWFRWGVVGDERSGSLPAHSLVSYIDPMKKALQAGIDPAMLERAIDLLIARGAQ